MADRFRWLFPLLCGAAVAGGTELAGAPIMAPAAGVAAAFVAAQVAARPARARTRVAAMPARSAVPCTDLGRKVVVAAWHNRRAYVMYRGLVRCVVLADDASASAGLFRVVEARGDLLVVSDR